MFDLKLWMDYCEKLYWASCSWNLCAIHHEGVTTPVVCSIIFYDWIILHHHFALLLFFPKPAPSFHWNIYIMHVMYVALVLFRFGSSSFDAVILIYHVSHFVHWTSFFLSKGIASGMITIVLVFTCVVWSCSMPVLTFVPTASIQERPLWLCVNSWLLTYSSGIIGCLSLV